MKKSDYILISIIILICIIMIFSLKKTSKSNVALIYYNDEVILKVNLDKKKEYVVKGYLGNVVIETDINKIRVKEETSKRHLCSYQGWVSNSYTPIICLPNKIVIKIENESDIDTVVR